MILTFTEVGSLSFSILLRVVKVVACTYVFFWDWQPERLKIQDTPGSPTHQCASASDLKPPNQGSADAAQ